MFDYRFPVLGSENLRTRSKHLGAAPSGGRGGVTDAARQAVTSFLHLGPVPVLSPRCLPCTLAVTGQYEGSLSPVLGRVHRSGAADRRVPGRNCGWGSGRRPTRSPAPGRADCWTVSATPSANQAWTLRWSGCSKSGVTAPNIEPNQRSAPGSTVRVRTSLAQLRSPPESTMTQVVVTVPAPQPMSRHR